ncbi:hypothetical protein DSAG12_03278 [Promethearchaeum syntrophicum]|uniref:Uncharacterized protein n=1 Tax=Promethearchaeum syntrophicum TaxID=2594042 RepID=A0A5B9DEL8_9ARCH|nr:hypothetical protein [Candidatus Prometheoarchaeum syntrophicum]QEE17441.1 hypothetical protein DSAG12_03278 [Candidatus Prometheoarchaeum syntrophicum]
MKINEFMETIEPLLLENISISWNLYHNFENPPDETKIEGKFNIGVFPAESIKFEENASAIFEIKNPFPDIKFENKQKNYSVTLPSHRILTASLEEEKVVFTFMPHGIKSLEGFPTNKPISWGKCTIIGDTDIKSKILKILIQILFVNQEFPRSRCDSCKGLKMLVGDSVSEHDAELFDHQLICYDCLQGAESFFINLSSKITELETENSINLPREQLFQLIEGGIELADSLNNEKLHSEFLYFQALLKSKDENPQMVQESLELLEEIVIFSSSWKYNKLQEKSEKLKSKIQTKISAIKPDKEVTIKDKKEPHEKADDPVQVGIKLLQKAKLFEQQGKYQESVYCIKRASKPLVDSGVWSAADFEKAKQEIFRLTNLIEIVPLEPDEDEESKPIDEGVPAPVEEEVPTPFEEEFPASVEEIAPTPVEEEVPAPVEEIAPTPVEEEVPAPVEEEVPAPIEEEVPAPIEEEVPAPIEEEVPAPVEEIAPAPIEEGVPAPIEEGVPAPVEEEVPTPFEEVPAPVEEVVPETSEEEPISGSIEDIMKKIKKSNIQNLTLKPVKAPTPIKTFENSLQDDEFEGSKDIPSLLQEETGHKKLENDIKNLIEQQSSEDNKFTIKPVISSEESPISKTDTNSNEILTSKGIKEEKIEIKPIKVAEKIVDPPNKSAMSYNMFGVPNRGSNNKSQPTIVKDSEKQPSSQGSAVSQKTSIPKRRTRRRLSQASGTKTKVKICPMCAKLKCTCGYMDKVKK